MNRNIPLNHGLASQPRVQLKIRSLFYPVQLVVFHLRKIFHALFHHDVASGAGAASPAGVFQMKSEVHRHIEQGARPAMPFIGQLTGLELECFIGGEKRYLRHIPIVAARI